MPNDSANPFSFAAPWSGNVSQPWSWWYQLAPVTINQMQSGDPALEARIVREVASYGRQLGRVMDVLEVLVAKLDDTGLSDGQQRALTEFQSLRDEIDRLRRPSLGATRSDAVRVANALVSWRKDSPELFQLVKAVIDDAERS